MSGEDGERRFFEPARGADDRPALWSAALAAIPLALFLLALLEPLHLPFAALAKTPKHILRVMLLGVPELIRICLFPILFQINAAAVLAFQPRSPWQRRVRAAALALLAAGAAHACYRVLVEYEPFGGYPPFIALYVALAALLIAWSAGSGADVPGEGARRRALLFVARRGPACLMAIGFPAVYAAGDLLYRGAYPTLHTSALMISFLLLHGCLAAGIARFWRIRWLPAAVYPAAGLLAVNFLLLAPEIAATRFAVKARPVFLRYAASGRSAAASLSPSLSSGHSRKPATAKKKKIAPDHGAEARFLAQSNLPALPEDFDLSRYNILLVSVEATRYDATSVGAPAPGNTPSLRAFAEGRCSFSRAYTPAPYTMQVFASIFSMTFASASALDLGDKAWNGTLRDEQRTAAELLRAAGWATFAVSHDYRGLFRNFVKGLHQGFKNVRLMSAPHDDPDMDSKIAAEAISTLAPFAADKRRFFGWVFFESPHYPYLAHYPDLPGESRRELYDQEVRYADEQLGKLLAFLKESDLLDTTIVIVHGDHGEELADHGGAQHNDIYSEVSHVPLVVHVPGLAGRRVGGPTSLTYLFPWLFLRGPDPLREAALERLKVEIGPVMQRIDGAVVTERLARSGARVALTWPGYRLIHDEDAGFFELYDLSRDPSERNNVADDDERLSGKLRKRFGRFVEARDALARWRVIERPRQKAKAKAKAKPKKR